MLSLAQWETDLILQAACEYSNFGEAIGDEQGMSQNLLSKQ